MAQPQPQRYPCVDALRGAAMLWMTAYHFGFDLNHFGFVHQDFYEDPVWTVQRTLIVSLFLLTAGMGQAIAVAQGQDWRRFGRRWAQVAACALLVSAGSAWMFPHSWISFGVLHALALMLLATRWLLVRGRLRGAAPWLLGALLVAAGPLGSAWLQGAAPAHPLLAEALDSRWGNWLGWVTHKPATEDYVPLLPWWGVMLWGVGLAQWAQARPARWLLRLHRPLRWLAGLGRWSLSYYMLHQPLLIGALMAWQALRGG